MNNDPDGYDRLQARALSMFALVFAVVVVIGWGRLAQERPNVWAVMTALIFAVVTGLGTARMFFGNDDFLRTLAWTPIFGAGWLSMFWILFKIIG